MTNDDEAELALKGEMFANGLGEGVGSDDEDVMAGKTVGKGAFEGLAAVLTPRGHGEDGGDGGAADD